MKSAPDYLLEAAAAMGDRAKERDTEQERSMAKTVAMFNTLFGATMTEAQGWSFMVLLKMVRGVQGNFRADDFVDAAAYVALWAECLSQMNPTQSE